MDQFQQTGNTHHPAHELYLKDNRWYTSDSTGSLLQKLLILYISYTWSVSRFLFLFFCFYILIGMSLQPEAGLPGGPEQLVQ